MASRASRQLRRLRESARPRGGEAGASTAAGLTAVVPRLRLLAIEAYVLELLTWDPPGLRPAHVPGLPPWTHPTGERHLLQGIARRAGPTLQRSTRADTRETKSRVWVAVPMGNTARVGRIQ